MPSPASEHLTKYFDPTKGEMTDVLIRAGAGAGKTTELVRRVISLALQQFEKKQEWPRLVVTTFTRKATQELRERLLHAGLQINHPGLLRYLQSSQSLHISTIHGILTVYLKKYGRELDLPPDFQIMDNLQATRLARRAMRTLLKESTDFARDFQMLLEETNLRTLEEAMEKWSALGFEGNPQRLTLADLEKEWQAEQALVVKDMQDVVHELESVKLTDNWQAWLGHFKNFLASAKIFPERVIDFNDGAPSAFRKNKDVGEDLTARARLVKKKIEELQEYSWTEAFRNKHEELSQAFERVVSAWSDKVRDEKKRQARLTMEDLELFALWLSSSFPETARSFSNEWDYWLIDEYQDTSPRQVKLIRALTHQRKTFRVGDPQQSIYLFRGARSEVFLEAEAEVRIQNGELFELMKNYRTEAPVLEFMNELFVSASTQLRGMEVGRAHPPVSIFERITLWQVPEEKKSEGLQVDAVVQRIYELITSGVSAEQICVLARKRRDLAEITRRAQALGIPCQLHASGGFYDRREVLDALSFLKFLITPEDNENLVILLRSPWFATTDQQLLKICHPQAWSFWSCLRDLKPDPELAPTIQILEQALARVRQEGVARVWRDLLIARGVFDEAKKLDPSGRREANLWKLVQNLFDQEKKPGFRYSDFIDQPEMASTEEPGAVDASPVIEPKRVQLMTVHASKGLQFAHVLVPFLNEHSVTRERSFFAWSEADGKWGLCLRDPESLDMQGTKLCENSFDLSKSRGLEELDRLFYVALTRAQESLTLFWGNKVKDTWAEKLVAMSVSPEDSRSWKAHVRTDAPVPAGIAMAPEKMRTVRAAWKAPDSPGQIHQTLSVTQLLQDTETMSSGSAGSSVQSWEKIRRSVRGTEVHRLMESLKFDPERKLATPEFQPALNFLDSPKGKFLHVLIKQGEVEWGFAVRLGSKLIQGQIDLWGRDESGQAWVIDYKTGTPENSDKALRQLEIYAWALKRLGKLKPNESVKLAAVFPFHNEIHEMQAPPESEIQGALEKRLIVLAES